MDSQYSRSVGLSERKQWARSWLSFSFSATSLFSEVESRGSETGHVVPDRVTWYRIGSRGTESGHVVPRLSHVVSSFFFAG